VNRENGYYWVQWREHQTKTEPFISYKTEPFIAYYTYKNKWSINGLESPIEDETLIVVSKRIEFPLKAFL